MEVSGHPKRGRPKQRWSDGIRKDMKETERRSAHETGESGE